MQNAKRKLPTICVVLSADGVDREVILADESDPASSEQAHLILTLVAKQLAAIDTILREPQAQSLIQGVYGDQRAEKSQSTI